MSVTMQGEVVRTDETPLHERVSFRLRDADTLREAARRVRALTPGDLASIGTVGVSCAIGRGERLRLLVPPGEDRSHPLDGLYHRLIAPMTEVVAPLADELERRALELEREALELMDARWREGVRAAAWPAPSEVAGG